MLKVCLYPQLLCFSQLCWHSPRECISLIRTKNLTKCTAWLDLMEKMRRMLVKETILHRSGIFCRKFVQEGITLIRSHPHRFVRGEIQFARRELW